MRSKKNTSARLAVACGALTTLLMGCAQGPSEAEFVQACMKSSSPQMGVTEAMCQCAAGEAKSTLPSELYSAMVLDMQGRKQEAEAAASHLSFEQRADFAMKQFAILGKCVETK
jgi:hypothetical protein